MNPFRCCLLVGLVLPSAALAQDQGQPLAAWEFSTNGDTEGWWPAHSLAPFQVADGVLKAEATGGDPYLCSSPEKPFAVEGNDYQYIEIRLKCEAGKAAEFFWAGVGGGRPYGYTASKERGFSTVPDGLFHVYRVFPLWTGQITQLRFDPVDDDRIEVDYIRIYQLPWQPSGAAPDSWEFDRAGDPDGLIPVADLGLPEVADGQATFVVTGPGPTLVTCPTSIEAATSGYVAVAMSSSAAASGFVYWNGDGSPDFPGGNSLSFELTGDGRLHTYNVDCSQSPNWKGEVRRLSLVFTAVPGTQLSLDFIRCRPVPQGPAELRVRSVRVSPTVALPGEPIQVTAELENAGGEEAPSLNCVLNPGEGVRVARDAWQGVAALAPGATRTVRWTLTVDDPRPGRTRAILGLVGAPQEYERTIPIIATSLDESSAVGGGPARVVRTTCKPPAAVLQMRDGGRWLTVARAASLYRLAWIGDDARVAEFPAQAPPACTVETKLTASTDRPVVDVSLTLRARRDLRIAAFGAPFWLVGDGGTGAQQDHALFPGLEYLVQGERSSSALDIAPPNHARLAPHPNKVTMPLMAVECRGRTVGLRWDPLQKWDGEHDRPTAVFASPNSLTDGDNHLLSLFVPSIPAYLGENELLSAKGYLLPAGKTLELRYSLFAQQGDVVLSCDGFFAAKAAPEPLPLVRSEEDYIGLAMRGLEEVLWNEETQGWAGVKGWAANDKAGTALYLYLASQVLPDDPHAAAWREKAVRVAREQPQLATALRMGGVAAALDAFTAGMYGPLGGQSEEGGWAFHPDEQRQALGQEGETAVGICAGPACSLLQAALITGDPVALEAGQRALQFMDRFDVPRAAQVWEVPVHTPDILASSAAADAYLAGYRATGKPEYLERAVFWARTGLPFLYTWQAAETDPVMRYGSIPVFGATFFTGSWFGRLVQWNGLAYAQTLNALSRYDQSLPWPEIARGIVSSGINQTQEAEGCQGLYPDSYGMMDNTISWGLMLGPQGLLRPLLALRGTPVDPDTLVARAGEGAAHITSAARVQSAELSGGTLRLVLDYPFADPYYTVVMPVAEPVSVSRGGQEVPRADDLDALPEGWSYVPRHSAVIVKVAGKGATSVAMAGVQPLVRRAGPGAG